jgi:hypothetical protein
MNVNGFEFVDYVSRPVTAVQMPNDRKSTTRLYKTLLSVGVPPEKFQVEYMDESQKTIKRMQVHAGRGKNMEWRRTPPGSYIVLESDWVLRVFTPMAFERIFDTLENVAAKWAQPVLVMDGQEIPVPDFDFNESVILMDPEMPEFPRDLVGSMSFECDN